jgi:hypothetical protein
MALGPQFSLINSEFNEFLFASVGEEKNGMRLSVLSALTRLGFDPWREAARLAGLPKEAAVRALAAAITMLPEGDWKVSDAGAIAASLVNRLPRRGGPATQPRQPVTNGDQQAKSAVSLWLMCVVFAVAVLFALLHQYTDHAPNPTPPSAVSATQR